MDVLYPEIPLKFGPEYALDHEREIVITSMSIARSINSRGHLGDRNRFVLCIVSLILHSQKSTEPFLIRATICRTYVAIHPKRSPPIDVHRIWKIPNVLYRLTYKRMRHIHY